MATTIPFDALPPDVLRRVIEDFVTREGTDYGERVFTLDEKVAHVKAQLKRGDAMLTWDEASQTVGVQAAPGR